MACRPTTISGMFQQSWLFYALLSAACAALIPIFGKRGMSEIDSSLATTVRSVIMTLFLVAVCSAMGIWSKVHSLHAKAVTMIVLSGVAGALSWLFYFKAIQLGQVSQVAPIDKLSMPLAVLLAVIILGDRPSILNWLGIVLIATGAWLAVLPARG